jgi:hypothetical protein
VDENIGNLMEDRVETLGEMSIGLWVASDETPLHNSFPAIFPQYGGPQTSSGAPVQVDKVFPYVAPVKLASIELVKEPKSARQKNLGYNILVLQK